VGAGRPLVPEILGQPAPVEANSRRGLSAIAEHLVTSVFETKFCFNWNCSPK